MRAFQCPAVPEALPGLTVFFNIIIPCHARQIAGNRVAAFPYDWLCRTRALSVKDILRAERGLSQAAAVAQAKGPGKGPRRCMAADTLRSASKATDRFPVSCS